MKLTKVIHDGYEVISKEVEIDEILDASIKNAKFGHRDITIEHRLRRTIEKNIHLKHKTESRKSFALRIARKIVREYEEKKMNDMILLQKPWQLIRKDFGEIRVEPLFNTAINKLRGKKVFFGPLLKYKEKGIIESNGVRYHIKLAKRFKMLIKKKIKDGTEYRTKKFDLDKDKINYYRDEQTRVRRLFYFKTRQ